MCIDRRRVLIASVSLFVSAGCLGEESLPTPFDLRIENQGTQPRELSVVIEHVTESTVYDETHQIASGEQMTESAVVEEPGRYQLTVTDITTDEERTADQHVELSSGEAFCGWFVARAEPESITATVPRCPDDGTESADGPT